MKKFIEFFKTSNHGYHLIGGFAVGLFAFTPYYALYAAGVAASCLELKDRLYGGRWDWVDWGLTVAGGAAAATIECIL